MFSKSNIINIKTKLTKEQAIKKISDYAEKINAVTTSDKAVDAFIKREKMGSTGFEDGFAIPHARSSCVKKPQVFILRAPKGITNWKTIDKKLVEVAIFLFIPDSSGELHMEILSSIAVKLMDNKFRKSVKNDTDEKVFQLFNSIIKKPNEKPKEKKPENKSNKSFIAITACPAGIAKTFMAKDSLETHAEKLGYNIHVETQGAGKQKFPLTDNQIEEADFVIIASEIKINLDRFFGKKIIVVKTKEAIHNCSKLIDKAKKAKVLTEENKKTIIYGDKDKVKKILSETKSSVLQVFNTPWYYLTIMGCLYAVTGLLGYALYGNAWIKDHYVSSPALFMIQTISFKGFEICMALFAATFAKKLYDSNKVFVLTFVVAFILNTPAIGSVSILGMRGNPNRSIDLWFDYQKTFNVQHLMGTSLFGGMLFAPIIAYSTKALVYLESRKLKNNFRKLFSFIGAQYFFVSLVLVASVFLGAPLAWIFNHAVIYLMIYPNSYWWLRFIIGGIAGLLITQDYGGTINKFTILTLIGLTQYDWRMRTLIAIAIPVASFSCGIFFKVFRKKLSPEDSVLAQKCYQFGKIGLTEGPLPFINKYKWKAHLPAMMTAFVATGLVYVLNLQIFKTGGFGILLFGGQAVPGLNDAGNVINNDISWLNIMIQPGKGIITILESFIFAVIGYYITFSVGILTYFIIAGITFNIGKNKPFSKGVK